MFDLGLSFKTVKLVRPPQANYRLLAAGHTVLSKLSTATLLSGCHVCTCISHRIVRVSRSIFFIIIFLHC